MPDATVDTAAIRERYADKQRAHGLLTSTVVVGPALGRLQTYAVVAAASADDVPGLVDEVDRLRSDQCNQLCRGLERGNAALVDELAGIRAQLDAAAEAGITRGALALRSRRDIVNLALAQAGQVRLLQIALGEAEARAAQLHADLVGEGAAERARLLGSEDPARDTGDAAPGVLGRYVLGVTDQVIGPRAIFSRCSRGCGAHRGGTILLTARSLDGALPADQAGLTIAELARQALAHEHEDHPIPGRA